jgi:purine-binding chemotaxis protein CheW
MKEADPEIAMNAIDKERILNARADAIRNKPEAAHRNQADIEVLQFLLGQEVYAIDVFYIREVVHLKELTLLPCTPSFILGIFNIRGKILSVIDLRRFFSLPEKGITNLNRVVVVQHGEIELGILADDVIGTCLTDLASLQTHIPTVTGLQQNFIQGISPDKTILIDIEKFLHDERIHINEQVQS